MHVLYIYNAFLISNTHARARVTACIFNKEGRREPRPGENMNILLFVGLDKLIGHNNKAYVNTMEPFETG